MDNNFYHLPVMINEVTDYLITKDSGYYADCTFGGGGHSSHLLKKYKNIKIIAFDQDKDAFKHFADSEKFADIKDRIIFCSTNFRNIKNALKENNITKINGLLADLGVSSKQLDDKERGFSFNSGDILDMRMNRSQELSAKEIVNTFSADKLTDIFREYGEEKFAVQIAKKITEERIRGEIKTCCQLHDIILKVKWKKGKTDPATQVFQALRIYVNDELGSLKELLDAIPEVFDTGARAVFLTYHSLEDRIVKNAFKNYDKNTFKTVNKKVITASPEEINANPRSRSAKMRVSEKQI